MEDVEANGERQWEDALLRMKLIIANDELFERAKGVVETWLRLDPDRAVVAESIQEGLDGLEMRINRDPGLKVETVKAYVESLRPPG